MIANVRTVDMAEGIIDTSLVFLNTIITNYFSLSDSFANSTLR